MKIKKFHQRKIPPRFLLSFPAHFYGKDDWWIARWRRYQTTFCFELKEKLQFFIKKSLKNWKLLGGKLFLMRFDGRIFPQSVSRKSLPHNMLQYIDGNIRKHNYSSKLWKTFSFSSSVSSNASKVQKENWKKRYWKNRKRANIK